MGRQFGDEIAVLDGIEIEDGRIGRAPATGEEYAKRLNFGLEIRRNVIDPSEGANYSGGSSAVPSAIPLMPSSIGLADFADKDLLNYMRTTSVLPARKNVISPSEGGNYSGGSSADPANIPLMPSSVGLAGCMGACYEGVPVSKVDNVFGSTIEIQDGRIGRVPATGEEYARRLAPGLEIRRNVVDPSEGANYSGGSSAVPEYIPLMPSSIGLAGLDGLGDEIFSALPTDILSSAVGSMYKLRQGAFESVAGQRRLNRLKGGMAKILRAMPSMHPAQKRSAATDVAKLDQAVKKIRLYRAKALLGKRLGRMSMAEALARQTGFKPGTPIAKVAKALVNKAKAQQAQGQSPTIMQRVAAAAANAV